MVTGSCCVFDLDAARGLPREPLEEHDTILSTIQISGIVFFYLARLLLHVDE